MNKRIKKKQRDKFNRSIRQVTEFITEDDGTLSILHSRVHWDKKKHSLVVDECKKFTNCVPVSSYYGTDDGKEICNSSTVHTIHFQMTEQPQNPLIEKVSNSLVQNMLEVWKNGISETQPN